jgi:hypothetical protein
LARHVETKLAPFCSPESIHYPAPDSLLPENLVLTFQQFCSEQNRHTWCSQTPKALSEGSPRRSLPAPRPFATRNTPPFATRTTPLSAPPAAGSTIRAVTADSTADSEPLTEDEEYSWRIYALEQDLRSPSSCFWCQKSEHRLSECPMAQRALKDPRARRVIRSMVSQDPNRSTYTASQVSQDAAISAPPESPPPDEDDDPDSDFH